MDCDKREEAILNKGGFAYIYITFLSVARTFIAAFNQLCNGGAKTFDRE